MRGDLLLRSALVLVTLAGACWAAFAQVRGPVYTSQSEPAPITATIAVPSVRANRDSLAAFTASRNPFRADRRSASMPFDPAAGIPGAVAAPSRPARPTPVLAGILLGDIPSALIDGIPGSEGTRLLRAGENAGPYRVRSIGNDMVVLQGPDTTWTLRLRRTFQ